MYEKMTLIILVFVVVTHSNGMSAIKNVKTKDFSNSRLSTDSQEGARKCNTEKCICYCRKNLFPKSSKPNSSKILGSSREATPERMKVDSFPVQPRQERMPDTIYETMTSIYEILPHTIRSKKQVATVGVPFTSPDRSKFLDGSNSENQHRLIFPQNSQEYLYSSGKTRLRTTPMTAASLSEADGIINVKRNNDLKPHDSIINGRKVWNRYLTKLTTEYGDNYYIGASVDSITEANSYPDYSTDSRKEESTADFFNTGETIPANYIDRLANLETESNIELKDTIKQTEIRGEAEIPPRLITTVPSVNIDMPANPEAKQTQEYDPNAYSISVPEYITRAYKKTKVNNPNMSKRRANSVSKSNIGETKELNSDANENFESTSITSDAYIIHNGTENNSNMLTNIRGVIKGVDAQNDKKTKLGEPMATTANYHETVAQYNSSILETAIPDSRKSREIYVNGNVFQEATTEESLSKYHEIDPAIIHVRDKISEPPINYYSPNNRILNYIKNHQTNYENEKLTVTEVTITDTADSSRTGNNNSDNLVGDKIDDIDITTIEANKEIVSTAKSSPNDIYTFEFPSSTTDESISQLQKLQLYYINDDVKLPLEIKKLEDGNYVLSISTNVCEQILKIKCPCCMSLQGYVIQSPKKDVFANDDKKDKEDQLTYQQTPTVTRKSTRKLEKEKEEESMSTHYPLNDRRKRNFLKNDLITILMPVLDFARLYNLSPDFNQGEKVLSTIGLNDEIWKYDKPLVKQFEHNQSKERDYYNNSELKKSRSSNGKKDKIERFRDLTNTQEEKDMEIHSTRFAEVSQSSIAEKSELHKLGIINDDQSVESGNQMSSLIPKRINIFKRKTERKSGEMKRDIGEEEILDEKDGKPEEMELAELKRSKKDNQRVGSRKQNVSVINVLKGKNGKSYEYERNMNSLSNRGIEIVKNMLYWFKDLLLDIGG